MEESGLPKKNLIIAVGLSFLVYLFWFKFMMPKPLPAPAQVAPLVNSVNIEPKPNPVFSEIPFNNTHTTAKILLDDAAPITELALADPKKQDWISLLLSPSRFLATSLENPNQALWQVKATRPDGLTLGLSLGKGSGLTKEFYFNAESQGFGTLKLKYNSNTKVALPLRLILGANLPLFARDQVESFAAYVGKQGLVVQKAKRKQTAVVPELAPGRPLGALGLNSRYDLAIVYDMDQVKNFLSVERDVSLGAWVGHLSLAPGDSVELPFYVGFKSDATLKQLRLENLLYGGTLGPIKRFVRIVLRFFYRIFGNYGVAIIFMTLAFQVLLLPVTLKNLKLSQKMKDLAPQAKLVQEKYKNDPKKLQTELMQLYRSHGTNPLGGCLLLLIQMPIFFALYGALNENYELYGAPFTLWIKNLAVADPTYVLPLLMGGAMFLQSKLNAAAITDPSQKMLSYITPVMFTFMFLKMPSGLVLYWLTSNLISLMLTKAIPLLARKRATA